MNPWHPLPQSLYQLIAERPNSVLLHTARPDATNHTSHLFLDPIQILTASTPQDLPTLFIQIESAIAQGHHAAGYLSYECGPHFEPATHITAPSPDQTQPPLAWFGIYTQPITFDHTTGLFNSEPPSLNDPTDKPNQPFTDHATLNIDEAAYTKQILKIKDLIAAGDTYQVNFTNRVTLETPLSPAEAYATLIRQQPVSYAAFLNTSGHHILSLSPELFFQLEGNSITTRPMKGTAPRGLDLTDDTVAAIALQNDEKNRSEHIMIVDLLRNDLGRICTLGSVHVEDLFTIERYPSLLQMTSTVVGTLTPDLPFYEIFRALFPSGSITGAPKIRTMQIIHDLEAHPRGIYTGAIGHIAPNRTATFNVAIRTLVLKDGQATMGVGGGIVTDSDPAAEYRECLLKAAFLTRTPDDFQLIETILWNPTATEHNGLYLLPLHLDRLIASATYFNFPVNETTREAITAQLQSLARTLDPATPHRVRLLLDSTGNTILTSTPFTPAKPTGRIRISTQHTHSTDLSLRHKTTRRTLYDREYKQAIAEGYDEVLFLNERNELTEGTISNLFVRIGDHLYTPPLHSGVLPGIYRRHLLETNPQAKEKALTLEDLHTADIIYICNSVRGINEVKLASHKKVLP